ncbi:unnamed protein product [Trichobilharzia regenti]|nr:unnamed protein product [Trichobilharzia regenti]
MKESVSYTMLCTWKQRRPRKSKVLQATMDNAPVGHIRILMGDMNAKLGPDNTGRELMGGEALGEMNENGELFADSCAFRELVIVGRVYEHKDVQKDTWVTPDGRTRNRIDFISISRKWGHSFLDTILRNGADVGSDHYLVQGTPQVKLKTFGETEAADRPHANFDARTLMDQDTKDVFTAIIRKRRGHNSTLATRPALKRNRTT